MDMRTAKFRHYERGEISRIIIILFVIILIVALASYGVIQFLATRKAQGTSTNASKNPKVVVAPKPVYDTTIGNTRLLLLSAENLGNIIKAQNSYESDIVTTEKFIRVVVGAQNKGKNNLAQYAWDVGNIVDSEGRNFVNINDRLYHLVPRPDLCGAVLKPEFSPVPCVKYYEVSKASKGLKLVVKVTEPKKQEALLDIKFNQ